MYRIIYCFVQGLVNIFLFPFVWVRTKGKKNLPKKGAFLLCSNHRSNLDPVLLALRSPRNFHYMAKEELFRTPGFAQLIKFLGAFPVSRGKDDQKALRTAMNFLRDGQAVLMFPEGTRSKTGKLGSGKSGAALIASHTKVPVIPTAIICDGPIRAFKPITVSYGEPFMLDMQPSEEGAPRENAREKYRRMSAEIMAHIQALIDEHEQAHKKSKNT
jgi:1-acyl-sn-glycerol-3-phosphate acyltransferase